MNEFDPKRQAPIIRGASDGGRTFATASWGIIGPAAAEDPIINVVFGQSVALGATLATLTPRIRNRMGGNSFQAILKPTT
ncbi:hypothetical protein KX816_04895 [Sphingosinicellaceae bacterium]|nr:hypothetical protein KX816_04895 [Sphingosinicellaceae bacterium]